ncbi:MAG: hypothetical protein LBT22_03895, partial [Peptococcaceae bacterium]|nr:hypothetical protein [Peptococcaceae bacterium]
SRVAVAVDERPVFLDHNRLIPAEMAVGGIGFFEGYACQGLLYVYGYDQIALPKGDGIEAAVSKARAGYTVRILGDSGDAVYQFMKNIFLSVAICGQTDTPQF